MKGFVVVRPRGCASDPALKEWVSHGVRFARALTPKAKRR